jgi:hypothetical protein
MQTPFETATTFVQSGIAVIPVRYHDKRPAIDPWKPYQVQLPTEDELKAWFPSRLHNIGIVTGWRGLTVIDFDEIGYYARWLIWSKRMGGTPDHVASTAFRVRTSRGIHVYIRLETPEHNRHMPGVDIKSTGGYVLGPWSTHPTGAIYTPQQQPWIFPKVNALSDVLPAELLQTVELPDHVQPPTTSIIVDPWVIAGQMTTKLQKDAVDHIKKTVKVQDYFPRAVSSDNGNRWMISLCPFHDDHKPSFWIDTKSQICGCFAGCTPKPLDVINLHARLYGLTNTESIRLLASGL